MAVFLGNTGHIRLRRGSNVNYGSFADSIKPDDVTTGLNRLSFDAALDNLLTGDRLVISTDDTRGLVCFDPTAWGTGVVENNISAYINVNAAGGLRFFPRFEDAVNNNRAAELPVYAFTGNPINIDYTIRDTRFNILGNVTGYSLNTDREAIDVTSLSDKFRQQYSAGIISGNGSIDCLFDYTTTGVKETPLLMLQLIQRVDVGSQIDIALYLTDKSLDGSLTSVYYETSAVITRAGVNVAAGDVIECTLDFVTNGEIRLLIGEPAAYILKEDDDLIELEQSLDFLLKEVED
jgi:hypothetical protein